ncbi:transcription initiation factor IIA large subunit-like [Papaver somniferum]|uniref:transcription initiation factor IIA large subunit-like n=1 Tax=Papaver somniferum TaxID=3469 RepID=UPI000E7048D7|nr:transcription initiation factor IIA large subunit-like [Papaver somniferum]
MSNPATVSRVYIGVVEDVVSKMREEFNNKGVDESVLNDLQALWKLKLMQTGVIRPGQPDHHSAPRGPGSVPTPVHDLNAPFESTFNVQDKSAAENQRPLGVDVIVAQEEVREEGQKFPSQPPGTPTNDFCFLPPWKRSKVDRLPRKSTSDEGNPKLGKPEGEEDEELNEDDDLLDDLDQEYIDEPRFNQLVLSQFVSVSTQVNTKKNKWKCVLKNGMVHLKNNRDILFTEAKGEFDF